jgi:saccharopine dehydrogenase-like NADP-dependent oxidoreductase
MKIAVLGAGMVGRTIAVDLADRHDVYSFDRDETALQLLHQKALKVTTHQADLSDLSSFPSLLKDMELVITAVPGFMGFRTLEAVIRCGKPVVDISFFPEDALQLNELAQSKGVTVVTDCGVAPGMGNLILGRYNEEMKVNRFECYVGGLPAIRKKPFEYKAPFSPVDVIEEYTRPARQMETGRIVTKPALSDRSLMDFEGIGTLEAFNTDGLRSLLYTMAHIPDLKEQTLRYPGHIDLIQALQLAGFFSEEKMELAGGQQIRPIDFSSALLFRQWKLGEEEAEFTVMRVIVEGEKENRPMRVEYNLLDQYDPTTKTSSMSRTTGYTCTAVAELVATGQFSQHGVFPPERVGSHKNCFEFILRYLTNRGVNWKAIINH